MSTVMVPATCRVAQQAEAATLAASTLQAALRKLKRLQVLCQECPQGANCVHAAAWSNRLDAALRDIAEEWGLV